LREVSGTRNFKLFGELYYKKGGLRMDLFEMLDKINSREDLIKFINHLRMDLQTNRAEWENITLDDYLEPMEAGVNDMDGYYLNLNQPMQNNLLGKQLLPYYMLRMHMNDN
jgi:hypothetical protein